MGKKSKHLKLKHFRDVRRYYRRLSDAWSEEAYGSYQGNAVLFECDKAYEVGDPLGGEWEVARMFHWRGKMVNIDFEHPNYGFVRVFSIKHCIKESIQGASLQAIRDFASKNPDVFQGVNPLASSTIEYAV